MKKMIIFAVLGAFLACGLWFVSAFAAEMKRGGKADANGKTGDGGDASDTSVSDESGKEAEV